MTISRKTQRGLTLIETLVAMAILGLVVTAILALISQSARFMSSSEDRIAAGILADNLMVEAMANAAPLERGEAEEPATFVGAEWMTKQTVTDTGVDGLIRIDIVVRRADSAQVLATATTLKAEKAP
ncbi:MAG: type II secretion system minor pseudopilin GspI [Amphiplicatus sp.]